MEASWRNSPDPSTKNAEFLGGDEGYYQYKRPLKGGQEQCLYDAVPLEALHPAS
jgi:hypothetical protein